MNKDDTRKALLAPDEALIALGYEGLVKWREVAERWVDSDFDYVISSDMGEIEGPEWIIDAGYKLPEPEQWDCGIDFGTPCVANAKCYLVGEEFYQEAVKLIPLIKLNKLIEEKNKETGWVADWNNFYQKKVYICFDEGAKKLFASPETCVNLKGIYPLNPACADEVLDMLNKGLVKGIEK